MGRPLYVWGPLPPPTAKKKKIYSPPLGLRLTDFRPVPEAREKNISFENSEDLMSCVG